MKLKNLYILFLGAMLATHASAQLGLGEWPKVVVPEGYRLDSTYSECWHPRYDQGKHQPYFREVFKYDSQGRQALYQRFSFTGYRENAEGVTESFILDEPDLWEEVRYHYSDKGKLDCQANRSYDFYAHGWMEDYTYYSDFDETTGLPKYSWYSSDYQEGDERKRGLVYTEIIKYHDKTPETAYTYGPNVETGEQELYAIYQREFNDWGGIAIETYETQYLHSKTTYQYDDHHNLTAVCDTTNFVDGDCSMGRNLFFNEYDEDGLLISVQRRPASAIEFFDKTFYYWSKVDGSSGITALSSDKGCPTGWYDLSGRRLAGQPSRPGLYIKDGKKVAVK